MAFKIPDINDLRRALDDLPPASRMDIAQLALDLVGIVDQSGAADLTSAFISLCRGDLLGFGLSAVSVIPFGDIAKVGKLPKAAKAVRELVQQALKNPQLAWAIRKPVRQLKSLLLSAKSTVSKVADANSSVLIHLDNILADLNRYLAKIVPIEKFGAGKIARKNGSQARYQRVLHDWKPVSVGKVVDILESGQGSSGLRSVREGAEELLGQMALADKWEIVAPIHKTSKDYSKLAGTARKADRSTHITVRIEGISGAFHIQLNKAGHLIGISK